MSYDIAQICRNGHMINEASRKYPSSNKKHCPDCGALTIDKCPNCQEYIKGRYLSDTIIVVSRQKMSAPKFCEYCGNPFPWTESALNAAKELADGLEALNEDEKEDLKKSIDDMVKDTPRTTVAAQKFKKLIAKAGDEAAFKALLMNVLAQVALHRLGWL